MSAGPRRRLALTCSIAGAALVALDGTVLTVVQPTLQRELGATVAQVQWTGTGYLIAVAALLVVAGRLGDLYGHGRLFAVGVLGFGAASAGIGLAPSIGWVVALRVAQGVFGALLQPATLGMLRAAYPPDRLGMPIALRTGAIGLAAAAGPLLGGALTAWLGWRPVFLLNVGPTLLVGAAAFALRLPVPARRERTPLDLPGAALLALSLAAPVYALTAWQDGARWPALALLVGGGAAAAFARRLRTAAHPLFAPRLLGAAPVAGSLGVLVAASAALFGTLFVGNWFLQDVQGLDPLTAGLRALPLPLLMVIGAPVSAVAARRYGPRRTVAGGLVLLALGAALLSRLDAAASAPATGGCFLLMGAGFGAVMVTATAVVVRHVEAAAAGVAGGLQQTALNVGPTLGTAVATLLLATSPPPGPALVLALLPAAAVPLALRALPGPSGRPAASAVH
ncbi:MFS transporter [Kitasatospora terrestris]|uniref:Major facilitator superfamily (MFS) profile domain-containing protein n=1 Tax=Kitasatospora terrestris TaxID=258051 RepID=A0ABP9DJG9_9ACTN